MQCYQRLRRFPDLDEVPPTVVEHIRAGLGLADDKDNPADLINVGLEELLQAGRELPGYTTLDRMVAKIRAEVNADVYAAVAARIAPARGPGCWS